MTKRSSKEQFVVYLRDKDGKTPVRIVRANGWERMIIRLIHAHIRAHPTTSISTISLLKQEFGLIMENPYQDKAFEVYKKLLENKPEDQLGVYLKSDPKIALQY